MPDRQPSSPDDSALQAVLLAAVERALEGVDEDGSIDPDTQAHVDAIAELADDPDALAELMANLPSAQDGSGPTTGGSGPTED